VKETSFSQAGNALLWQATQHFGVKAIFLVRLLILARLLSPDDFGLLAISSVVIDVLMRVTNFGMIPALVQRVEAGEEHYDVAWTVGILRALTIAAVTFLAAPIVAQLFAEPRATDIIRVLAIRPLIDAAASIQVARLTRNLHFRSLAFIELPKALANTVVAVASAQWLGVWALVAGALAGSTTYLVGSYMVAPHRPRLNLDRNAARSLIKFGQWVFFTSLVAMAGQSVLRMVIARELGASELGLYYLAASLAFLPADVASQVVGQVAFPFYSRLQEDMEQVAVAFRSILTSLSALLVPACALLIAVATSLVDNLLGPEWQGTATIIRVLALASVFGLLGETIGPILQGTGRPDRMLAIEAVQSSILVVLAWAFAGQFGVVGAALAWLPATGTAQIAGILFLRQILPRPFSGLLVPIGAMAAVSATVAVIAMGIDFLVPGVPGLLLAGITGVSLMGFLLWILERRFALGISDGLVQAFPRVAALVGFRLDRPAQKGV
jgi:O-antigen/teichoic acid export membrane protein